MKKTKITKETPLKLEMTFEEAIQKIVRTPKAKVDEKMKLEKSKINPKTKK